MEITKFGTGWGPEITKFGNHEIRSEGVEVPGSGAFARRRAPRNDFCRLGCGKCRSEIRFFFTGKAGLQGEGPQHRGRVRIVLGESGKGFAMSSK